MHKLGTLLPSNLCFFNFSFICLSSVVPFIAGKSRVKKYNSPLMRFSLVMSPYYFKCFCFKRSIKKVVRGGLCMLREPILCSVLHRNPSSRLKRGGSGSSFAFLWPRYILNTFDPCFYY